MPAALNLVNKVNAHHWVKLVSKFRCVFIGPTACFMCVVAITERSEGTNPSSAAVHIFTALHGMSILAVRLPVRPYASLSVCPSVKRVDCDKTEEQSVQIFIPYERSFSLVLLRKRMVGGERPRLPEILGQRPPLDRTDNRS